MEVCKLFAADEYNALETANLATDTKIVVIDVDVPTSETIRFISYDAELLNELALYLKNGGPARSLLRVEIIQNQGKEFPAVHGSYEALEDGLRFSPHFPFERGLSFTASFDGLPLGLPGRTSKLDFSFPRGEEMQPAVVKNIFPSSYNLPENLLRFYIHFSQAMERGSVATEIVLLGPDEHPADDVLYRAPVELWDNSMQYLTVLLDPGRLKRGVGPNKELGPPLTIGAEYKLVIGPNITDALGNRLGQEYSKRFRVGEAVREPVDVTDWIIASPRAQTVRPLVLSFPRPLDRALLPRSLSVALDDGQLVEGRATVARNEKQWSFEPEELWASGQYQIRVGWGLEDVCGNGLLAPFDRAVRPGSELAFEVESQNLPFLIA